MSMSAVSAMVCRERLRYATDSELVKEFVAAKEEQAFAELVRRHGPMVLRLCRRFAPNDADDAFQAVFLVLLRRAASIRDPSLLASWLHSVAYRVARKAARRRKRPDPPLAQSVREPGDELAARELINRLDDEVARLSETERTPLLLVYWQGRSYADAARELRITVPALNGRLERGRNRLAKRLRARGIHSADLTSILLVPLAQPSVSADLAAKAFALTSTSIAIPTAVASLAGGTLTMKTVCAGVGGLVLTGAGVFGLLAGAEPQVAKVQPAAVAKAAEVKNDPDVKEILRAVRGIIDGLEKGKERDELLRSLSFAVSELGDAKGAEEIANLITDDRTRESPMLGVAVALAKRGEYKAGTEIAEAIKDKTRKFMAKCGIVEAAARRSDFVVAKDITDNSPEDGLDVRVTGHLIIIDEYVNQGRLAEALEAVEKITNQHNKQQAQVKVACGHAKMGNFKEAIQLAKSLDERFKTDAITKISIELAEINEKPKAFKLLADEFNSAQALPSTNRREQAERSSKLFKIVQYQALVGDIGSTVTNYKYAVDTIPKKQNGQLSSYGDAADVASALARHGAIPEAFEIAEMSLIDSQKTLAMCFISQRQYADNDKKGALSTLSKACEISGGLTGDDFRTKRAREVIAETQVTFGDFDAALQTVEKQITEGDRPDVLGRIVRIQFEKNPGATMVWIRKQEPVTARARYLIAVADGLIEKSKPAKNEKSGVPTTGP